MSDPIELRLHRDPVHTVFDLLGDKEDDITYSLGWGLANSRALTKAVLREFYDSPSEDVTAIRLQEPVTGAGRTDVEIETDKEHLVLEAKRGWNLPLHDQLAKYAGRLAGEERETCIAGLAECSPEYVQAQAFPTELDGVRIEYLSWKRVAELVAATAGSVKGHAEKRLLNDLLRYLKGLMTMQNVTDNRVYVVSLGTDSLFNTGITFKDIVLDYDTYFHPMGKSGFPHNPPNYLGFRFHGKLQQIRHVEDYKVADAPWLDILPEADWPHGPHLRYVLGPPIEPPKEVKTGNLYRAQRVWCALDLLLTSDTIREARDLTQKRLADAGEV